MTRPVAVMTLHTRAGWRHEGIAPLWSYSVNLFRQHLVETGQFTGLVLHADVLGAAWAKSLELPFTEIVVADFSELPPAFAAAKLATYSRQTGPFIHFDGDVLIARPLPEWLLAAPAAFERVEPWCPCNGDMASGWELPPAWQSGVEACCRLAWNCGLAGGQDWTVFAAAADTCLGVLRLNASRIKDGGEASVFCEQWGLARELPRFGTACLLPGVPVASEAAAGKYWHLAAKLKTAPEWQRFVARGLRAHFPAAAARALPP